MLMSVLTVQSLTWCRSTFFFPLVFWPVPISILKYSECSQPTVRHSSRQKLTSSKLPLGSSSLTFLFSRPVLLLPLFRELIGLVCDWSECRLLLTSSTIHFALPCDCLPSLLKVVGLLWSWSSGESALVGSASLLLFSPIIIELANKPLDIKVCIFRSDN